VKDGIKRIFFGKFFLDASVHTLLMKVRDVVSIGNIVVDFVAANVSEMPKWGQLVEVGEPIRSSVGGNSGIFSCVSSRLGLKVSIVGAVGTDFMGDWVVNEMQNFGVDTSYIKQTDTQTSTTLAMANPEGERAFVHYVGSNARLTLEDIDQRLISDSRALMLSAYFIMPGLYGEPSRKLLAYAKEKGVLTVFDVAWDPHGRWVLDKILENVDIFIPNIDEAEMLAGTRSASESSAKFIEMGAKMVVIKMGKEGVFVRSKNETFHIPAFKVKAIDATGAGDTFNASFVYAYLKGWELKKCAIFANAAGALKVTKVGGVSSAPTEKEIMEFIEKNR